MPIGASQQEEDKMEIKMTGMIDVVFLLLIFFIVTMQIPEPEVMIETELPRAEGVGESEAEEEDREDFEDLRLHLVWNETADRAEITFNNQSIPGQDQLRSRLEMAHRLHPDGRVIIMSDDDVPYDDLIQTISTVQMTDLAMAFADL